MNKLTRNFSKFFLCIEELKKNSNTFIHFRCKTDETVQFHPSTPHFQRLSYEAFSFVGVNDPVTYLHCDILICDVNAPDKRCVTRECHTGNNRSKHRKKRDYLPPALEFKPRSVQIQSKISVIEKRKDRTDRGLSSKFLNYFFFFFPTFCTFVVSERDIGC